MQKGMEIERGLSGAGLRKYFDHFQEMTVAHVRYSRIKTTDLATVYSHHTNTAGIEAIKMHSSF
jgi:hypothetical protein